MRTTLLLVALLPLMAYTQSWCPPGATWTYEAGMFVAGFKRMTYRADSIVDGFPAQVIDRYAAIQYPQPTQPVFGGPPDISYTPVAAITRYQNDVVYLHSSQGWDTLYWFGAAPGQGWTAAHVQQGQDCAPFVVADTGTTMINGMALRWIEIESWYRVYERIGSTWDMFMYCPNWIIDGPMGMRCYSDDDISFQLASGECEQLVGLNDMYSTSRTSPFPNPGTTHFTLDVPPGLHTITLCDATGRVVLEQRTADGRPVIGTEALLAGLYRVTVRDEQGRVLGGMWMKAD
jgi:hypothetical protein